MATHFNSPKIDKPTEQLFAFLPSDEYGPGAMQFFRGMETGNLYGMWPENEWYLIATPAQQAEWHFEVENDPEKKKFWDELAAEVHGEEDDTFWS